MAGHPTNFDTLTITAGTAGQIWAGLAVPAADAMLVIDPLTGTPDATTNPDAVHLGMTMEGSTANFEMTSTDFFADEFAPPIKTIIEQTNAQISGSFLQVLDFDVLEVISAGFGRRVSPAAVGVEQITIGQPPALTYTGVALIFPTEEDVTKYAVVHLYSAINVEAFSMQVSRKGQAQIAFNFKGRALTSRDPLDCMGNYWKQTAGV